MKCASRASQLLSLFVRAHCDVKTKNQTKVSVTHSSIITISSVVVREILVSNVHTDAINNVYRETSSFHSSVLGFTLLWNAA